MHPRPLVTALLVLALPACAAAPRAAPRTPAAPVPLTASAARPPYTVAQLAAVVDIAEVAIAPDGGEVAFVTDRSGAFELWTVPLRDGVVGEARQRTHADEQVSGLAYSPDGALLVFEMDHGGDERTDLWLLRRGADAPERLTDTPTAERAARFSPDGRALAFERDTDRPFRFNVHVMDLATRRVTQLTREPVNVMAPRWSRDGRTLVATRSGDDQRGDLAVIDVASGRVRFVPPPRADGIAWPVGFLPDGALLATATNDAGFTQLATVDLARGAARFVGAAEWDVEAAEVADDGAVMFVRNVRGESRVEVAPSVAALTGGTRVVASGGVVGDLAVDRAGRRIVLLHEASNHPPEILALDAASAGPPTTLVPSAVAGVQPALLAEATRRSFRSFDGIEIDAFLWRPPVARLGAPPPLVVHVHGGPNGQTRGAFSPQIQALAEAGFVVASVNYRGSTGYGRAFEDLNNRDWGGGDLRDIVAVVEALGRAGEVDRARVGIVGGSYGGYMTLRAITAEPAVWRAAVDMFGMPDLEEDYRITADRFGSWYLTEMGDPARDAALYRDRSPVHALDRVRAPLLVLQGANDTNVPRVESDAVVAALRGRGQRVEYTVYPNEGHGFTHRDNRVDAMSRTVAFFLRELGR